MSIKTENRSNSTLIVVSLVTDRVAGVGIKIIDSRKVFKSETKLSKSGGFDGALQIFIVAFFRISVDTTVYGNLLKVICCSTVYSIGSNPKEGVLRW